METFAVGTACCWTGYKFGAGEQAMKCLSCEKVMKTSAWEEKPLCRCGSNNFVPARASNSTSSIRLGNSTSSSDPPRQPRPEISWETPPPPSVTPPRPRPTLNWQDPPPPVTPPRPRRQPNWRDSPPPVTPPRPRQTRRSHELRWREPKTPALQKWHVILMSAIGGFLAFMAIALLSQ